MAGSKESGQAILLVVMVTAIILLLGTSAVTVAATGFRSSLQQRDQMQGYYVAEAGVELALARIKSEPSWFEGLPEGSEQTILTSQPYAGGTVGEVKLRKLPGGIAEIISKGSFGVAHKTIKASLVVTSELVKGISVLPDDAATEETKVITGSLRIAGNGAPVILNGSYDFRSGAINIDAEVFASGDVDYKGDSIQTVHENYQPIPVFPEIDLDWYKNEAARAGQYYSGSQTFGSGTYNGVYYVEGDITISGTYQGQAIFVAAGNISLPHGNEKLQADSPPEDFIVLMAPGGTVQINNGDVDAFIIANYFEGRGNGIVNGSILVQGFDTKGCVYVNCQPVWVPNILPFLQGVTPLKIKSWEEGLPIL